MYPGLANNVFFLTLVVLYQFDGCSLVFAVCLVKYCEDETSNIEISKEVPQSSTSSCCRKFMEERYRKDSIRLHLILLLKLDS